MSLRETAVALIRHIDQARSADHDPLELVESQLRLIRQEGVCQGGKDVAKAVESAFAKLKRVES